MSSPHTPELVAIEFRVCVVGLEGARHVVIEEARTFEEAARLGLQGFRPGCRVSTVEILPGAGEQTHAELKEMVDAMPDSGPWCPNCGLRSCAHTSRRSDDDR